VGAVKAVGLDVLTTVSWTVERSVSGMLSLEQRRCQN